MGLWIAYHNQKLYFLKLSLYYVIKRLGQEDKGQSWTKTLQLIFFLSILGNDEVEFGTTLVQEYFPLLGLLLKQVQMSSIASIEQGQLVDGRY